MLLCGFVCNVLSLEARKLHIPVEAQPTRPCCQSRFGTCAVVKASVRCPGHIGFASPPSIPKFKDLWTILTASKQTNRLRHKGVPAERHPRFRLHRFVWKPPPQFCLFNCQPTIQSHTQQCSLLSRFEIKLTLINRTKR